MGTPVHINIDIDELGNVKVSGENIEYTTGRVIKKIERLITLEVRRKRRSLVVAARQQPDSEPEDVEEVPDTEGQKEESKDSGKLAAVLANFGLGKSKSEVE